MRVITALLLTSIAAMPLQAVAEDSSDSRPSFHPEGGQLPREEHHGTVIGKPATDESCRAQVTQQSGVVHLSIRDPLRANSQTTFSLDEMTYAAHFDSTGMLQAQGPMLHQTADLEWKGTGDKPCRRSGLIYSNFQNAFLIVLVWTTEAAGLTLHVVEPPNGRFGGGTNYVYPVRPNLDGATGLGQLRTFGAPVPGTSQVQIYSLPPEKNPHQGSIYAFIEFASRGNPAQAPFCGSDPKAVVSFKIIHLDSGSLERRNGKFGAVPCGSTWTSEPESSGLYQIWKWNL